jgi:hypothetical protein
MKRFLKRKAQFYYVRNMGHRVATVCLYEVPEHKGVYCRGISICSVKDNFNPEMGKEEALQRCREAYHNGYSTEPIALNYYGGERALTLLRFSLNYQGYKGQTVYKSAWTNRLSAFERKIMTVRHQMDERRSS